MAHIVARTEKIQQLTFERLRKSSIRALSLDADLNYETLRSVMNGGAVGSPTVTKLVSYVGAGFDDLFKIVDDDEPAPLAR